MTETEWDRFVEGVLRGIEPEDEVARRNIRVRLEHEGTLPTLKRAALAGGDASGLAKMLFRLAEQARSALRIEKVNI